MQYLLDTHTLLWYFGADAKLSPIAKNIIEDTDNEIFVSIISLWEIAIKVNIGKLALQGTYKELLGNLADFQIQILPLTVEDTVFYLSLPAHHKDPFDRIIIAQMQHNNLPILGTDEIFDAYPVQRIW